MTDDDEAIEARFVPAVPSLLPPGLNVSRNRSRHNRGNHPLRPGFKGGEAHPEYVVEIAFICYVRAARNVRQTVRLMRQDWDALAPTIRDGETGKLVPVPFPETLTHNTLYKWRRVYEWDSRLNEEVGKIIPLVRAEHHITAELGAGQSVRFLVEVMQGDHQDVPDPRHVTNRIKAAELLIVAAGLGTHGTMNRVAPVIRQTIQQAIDVSSMDNQELSRTQRDYLAQQRKSQHEFRKR